MSYPHHHDTKIIRTGRCVARQDCKRCWASYAAGVSYLFEELLVPYRGRNVTSYRIENGPDSGFAGPSWFERFFVVVPQ